MDVNGKRARVRERLNGIFRDVFDNETIEVHDGMTARDVQGWDSLNHVTMIYAVEKGFGVSFTTKEVSSLANVGDLVNLVVSKTS